MKKNILFRLDAGDKVGMGHLSRCLSLADELISLFSIQFLIKTDNKNKVLSFLENRDYLKCIRHNSFIDIDIAKLEELTLLVNEIKKYNAFLVVDHYGADADYQQYLRKENIKWLQFDSHGLIDFYADIVLHASPGATEDIYIPLKRYENTEFLLGTEYAIVNKFFRNLRTEIRPRVNINNLLICFGGGGDNGLTLKCLLMLESAILEQINITVVTSGNNPKLEELERLNTKLKFNLIVDSSDMHKIMKESDLAIIAPGTLSYEAACVGLPMILIAIADNQMINAVGWEKIGTAKNIGTIEMLNSDLLNDSIKELRLNNNKLKQMSVNCLNAVDGNGPLRTKEKIKSIL